MHSRLIALTIVGAFFACDGSKPVVVTSESDGLIASEPVEETYVAPAAVVDQSVQSAVDAPAAAVVAPPVDPAPVAPAPAFTVSRLQDPPRTEVKDAAGRWLATFTDGARTVRIASTPYSIVEPGTNLSVTLHEKVRLLPAAFAGTVDKTWLAQRVDDPSPDVLDVALEYVKNASGDASYGPLEGGSRAEGSDFNDYLGVAWKYADGSVDPAEAEQKGALDCSGFIRMVFGYRLGFPLGKSEAGDGTAIPRRAVQQLDGAPGVMVLASSGAQATKLDAIAAGDLVFFDAATNDGPLVDHVGIYLGRDQGGRARFLSSRKTADGPTLGDAGGASLLEGDGLYARGFRAARRL